MNQPRQSAAASLWRFATISFASVALGFVGCARFGEVTGVVTFEGKPVKSGSVTLLASNERSHVAPLDATGNFRIKDVVSTGDVKIAVISPDPRSDALKIHPKNPKGTPPIAKAKLPPAETKGWFALPNRYADPELSSLVFRVTTGLNHFEVRLTK